MKFSRLTMASALVALAVTASTAFANTYQSYLEYSEVSIFGANTTSNTPPFFGLVTLTEGGTGTGAYVDVTVDLTAGFRFIDSGNDTNHTSFAFNLTTPGSATISSLTAGWMLNAVNPSTNSPFGNYTTGLDCCASNGAPGVPSPLNFRVTSTNGITVFGGPGLNSFSSNTSGTYAGYVGQWWFSADVVGPDGRTTGLVASRDFLSSPVPEPHTYTMLLASLGLMGFVVSRRRAK